MSAALAVVAVLLVAAVIIYLRSRGLARLYDDAHLSQILSALPKLKDDAMGAVGKSPPVARIRTSAPMVIAYSVMPNGDEFLHHLSLSTTATPSVATGAFFLALLDSTLPFDGGARRAFVTQKRVFHLVRELSADEHRRYAEATVPVREASEVRENVPKARDALAATLETHD